MKTSLSADMNDPEAIPYFLWDEPMTVAQFKERLASASIPERMRLIGKLLREARETKDRGLFTSYDALEDAVTLTSEIARQFNATLEAIRTAPDFRRFLLRREADAIVIDLVRDRVPQIIPEKPVINGIRVDPPEE